jgi:gliding motility-associated-like protein
MVNYLRRLRTFALFSLFCSYSFSQSTCATAQAICSNPGNNIIPASTGAGNAAPGPNYGCLTTQPNPSWSFIQIQTSGNISLQMSGSAGGDIDFIAYGPFASLATACSNLTAGNTAGCSYSGASVETFNLVGAVAGQFYIILNTNFSNAVQNIVFNQTGGSGSISCVNVCNITGMVNSPGACSPATNQYNLTGTLSTSGLPTAGSLTITNSCGGTPIVLTAPYTAPITYTFNNLPSNGATCSVTARFSTMTTCSLVSTYLAPVACNTCAVNASNSGSICSGASNVTLSATTSTNVTGISWSGPSGYSSSSNPAIVITPTASGVYTVVGTGAFVTCSAVTNVTVQSLPTIGISPSSNPICIGNSATLNGTGGTTYTWSTGPVAPSVIVNPLVNTSYSVLATNGICSNTAAITLTVLSNPTVIASGPVSSVCAGAVSTLNASGATTYTWNPGSFVGSSFTVNPSSTTTYTVVGANGSCTSSAVYQLTVTPGPTVSALASPLSICPGASSSLLANGAVTYTWQPGGLTGPLVSVNPAVSTVYTVTGTNAAGCSGSATANVNVLPTPTISFSPSSPSICLGNTSTITASGATSYTWNPGNLSGSSVTLSPGSSTTYTVIGFNGTCVGSNTFILAVLLNVTVTANSSTNTICNGQTTTLSASGASSYTWNPGGLIGSSVTVSPSSGTTYTVTGDNGACSSFTTLAINVNPLPVVNANSSPTLICGSGTATLTATGASSYTWLPGTLIGASVTDFVTGTTNYTVTGASASGCTNSAVTSVSVNAIPVLTLNASPSAICNGNSSTLTASGALNYTWQPGGLSGATINVNPSTTTVYTVTGGNGSCISTQTVQLVVNPTPTITASATSTNICSSNSTTLSATGAISYTWNPGVIISSSIFVSPLVTTNYTVTGSSVAGCTNQAVITISVTSSPTVTASANSATICVGGTSTLNATGATNYTWNPGGLTGSSTTVNPVTSTVYTVIGTNGSCSNSNTVSVTVNPIPIIIANANPNPLCAGNQATLNASGASTYTWNPGLLSGSSVTVAPIISTVYTVQSTSALGCIGSSTVNLVVNPQPTITASSTGTNICAGSTVTLTASGGISYFWSPIGFFGPTTPVTPSVTTTYTVAGTSALGCVGIGLITISVTPIPTVNLSSSSASICSGNSATLTATGASAYTWNPGGSTSSSVAVSPLTNTTYTVIGANGFCTSNNSITLFVNPNPTINATASPSIICAGSSSTLSASGATSYTWNPGGVIGSTVNVSPTASTIYTVSGVNSFGCFNTRTVSVIVNPTPTITLVATNTSICTGNSTTITATTTGAGPFSYTWNPGGLSGSSVVVSPLSSTIFTVNGTNGTGCLGTRTINISVSPSPTITLSSSLNPICSGISTTLSATGATSYTWNPGSLSGSSVVVSPPTTTQYTVVGQTGICTATNVITVTVNPTPTLALNPSFTSTTICSGSSITATVSGASSYTWLPVSITNSIATLNPLTTTNYSIIGESAAGCINIRTFTINVTTTPTLNIVASSPSVCSGNSATLIPSGATLYTLSPLGTIGSTFVVTPSVTTTYTIAGNNGLCIDTETISIVVSPSPTLTAATSASIICAGSTASLGVIGANSYTWLPVGTTGSLITVSPSVTTNYTVIGQTLAGCSSNTTVLITVNPLPTITVNNPTASICSGTTLNLTATGANTYTWNPGSLIGANQTLTLNGSTIYTVAGTSSLGCNSTTVFTINVTPTPTIITSASAPSICVGESTTLTATGAGSYTWQPGSITGSLAVVSPTSNTTYTVTGQNGSCVSTQTINIFINPAPSITITPNNSSICAGSSATLTASGASTYTWIVSLPVVSPSIVVTPTAATNYTVIGTSISGCTTQAVASLSVDLTPTLSVSGATAVCSGNSATLVANGANTYTWLPFSITSSVAVVSPTGSTTYTLLGQNGACVASFTNNLNVGVTPTVNATISSLTVCAGSSVSLTATGASTYSWLPISTTGSLVTDLPTSNTVYTVIGTTTVGCSGTATVGIAVTPGPIVTITPSSTFVCLGGSATLNLSGATSYTWIPGILTGTSVVVTPTVTQTYTVTGENASGGCTNTQTVQISVFSTPTVTAASSNSALCSGQTATLISSGASTYTWEPGTITSSLAIVSPTTTTIYTVTGSNASCGTSTATVTITVNSIPSPTASVSGTISCATPSVNLTGASTPTSVSYNWSGPFSFTSSVQSPSSIAIAGVYTLSVTELTSGCSATSTINVQNDGSVPSISLTTTGNITCANTTVTLSAISSATNVGYAWQGPSSFTASTAIISTTLAGNYTLTVTDLTSNCPASTVAVIITNTTVPITTTVLPATCSGTTTNNNGSLIAGGFVLGDKFDFVSGTTYTGTATYTSAVNIPTTGVLTSTLTNPLVITPITIRYFGANGCIKDTTVLLIPTSCATNTVFGIAKSVNTVSLLTNSTYSVSYKVVVKNNSNATLNNVVLYENLNNTFPLPTTYTITSTPTIISTASSLTLEPSFNGSSQTILTNTLSVLNANSTDTLLFGLTISHNGKFGPFNNTVFGVAQTTSGIVYVDSSQVGNNPDFDNDGLFSDDNVPTPLNLPPKLFFGLTKIGAISEKLSDGTYDISYTITAHNLGNDTLKNVVIKDSLFNNTIRIPASYTLKNSPVASGSLIANPLYNGNTATNLITPSLSILPPGAISFVSFTINVNPDTVTVFSNSAFGSAISSNSTLVNDISGDGTNPDINNNGIWNEAADNKPTVLTISNFTLFVPQGFSPDGDGKNETWFIKGLPAGNKVTVFNRWGSKVFEQTEYSNTWNGFPNVSGALGSNKLPQGTYYYIIEFNDKSIKSLNGFVVLQY